MRMSKSTFEHLRFSYSMFLTPVILFAFAEAQPMQWTRAVVTLAILAVAIFPASQGFNSYYDRDDTSIGGLKHPRPVETDLIWWSFALEIIGIAMSCLCLGWRESGVMFFYGVASKLYSHPAVHLKSRPWLGFFTVVVFQGLVVYWLSFAAISGWSTMPKTLSLIASCALIGALYPITQVYQHAADQSRGVMTLSRLLKTRGTAIFSTVLLVALSLLLTIELKIEVVWLALTMAPGSFFLVSWLSRLMRNSNAANFDDVSCVLKRASLGANLGFLVIIITRNGVNLPISNFAFADPSPIVYVSSVKNPSGKPWFKLEVTRSAETEEFLFRDGDSGEILSQETVILDSKGVLQHYTWNQKQTHEHADVSIENHKLTLSYGKEEKSRSKTRTITDEQARSFVVPPMLFDAPSGHWKDLEAKDGNLNVRVIAPDLRDDFGFTFKHEKSEDGKTASPDIRLKLSGSSLFVRMAVRPVIFVFSSGHVLKAVIGFTPPVKYKQNSQFISKTTDIEREL